MAKKKSAFCACEQAEHRLKLVVERDVEFAMSAARRARPGIAVSDELLCGVLAHVAATRNDLARIKTLEEMTEILVKQAKTAFNARRKRRRR